MTRNGPLALSFHALVMLFMLAPLVVVCLVAFTPGKHPEPAQRRLLAALVQRRIRARRLP